MDESGTVVTFDNVGKGETVDQPTLAALLTASAWSDRVLQTSNTVRVPNDKVWLVTGNSLSVGGDLASRTVLVKLDARMPNPDRRPTSSFVIGDLEEWLHKTSANPGKILHSLLMLMRGWIVAGANRIETPMRTFTPWASATAGFLDWLREPGFMTNRDALQEVDEEEAQYGAFYQRWYELFGDRRLTAKELHDSAQPGEWAQDRRDWRGTFLVRKRDGSIPSAVGLGKMLASERGRFRGGYRLNDFFDTVTKVWSYSVTPQSTATPDEAE